MAALRQTWIYWWHLASLKSLQGAGERLCKGWGGAMSVLLPPPKKHISHTSWRLPLLQLFSLCSLLLCCIIIRIIIFPRPQQHVPEPQVVPFGVLAGVIVHPKMLSRP